MTATGNRKDPTLRSMYLFQAEHPPLKKLAVQVNGVATGSIGAGEHGHIALP